MEENATTLNQVDYKLSISIYIIVIERVVLGVQWLKSLGTISMNHGELFLRFSIE
jgi:uncharacterized membrane protein (Fun14 family)